MTLALVVVVLLLFLSIASVLTMHEPVVARLARLPWWHVVGVPAIGLGLVAILAAAVPPALPGWLPGAAAVLAVVVAVAGGAPVTTATLRGAELAGMPQIAYLAEPATAAEAAGRVGVRERPVLRGGLWIGVLERAAIASCLLTGIPEGAAVVLAVKSLGRYPELRAPGAAERFIIGTFTSLLWAAAAAGVAILVR